MSDRIHTPLWRSLAAAGLLIAAGLVRPDVTLAQTVTPEQALQSRGPAALAFPAGLTAISYPSHGPAVDSPISGEQALLGRTGANIGTPEFELGVLPARTGRPPVDGAEALLGRRDRIAGSR